jgi:hypothetical protein
MVRLPVGLERLRSVRRARCVVQSRTRILALFRHHSRGRRTRRSRGGRSARQAKAAEAGDPNLGPEQRQSRPWRVGAGPSHKDRTLHEVPLPRSLMHDELLSRVKELLGLPAKATLQQVVNAQAAERQRSDREARLVGLAFAIRSA